MDTLVARLKATYVASQDYDASTPPCLGFEDILALIGLVRVYGSKACSDTEYIERCGTVTARYLASQLES